MARRTFAEYKAAIVHALGGDPSIGVTTDQLVNDALQYLASLREWNWRRGGPVTLSLVADQAYVELPQDFGGEEVLTYPGSVAKQMIRMTMAEIEIMRAHQNQPPGFTYYYAVNSGSLDEDFREDGLTVNLIELFPTPTSSIADALTLSYRRNVDTLAADTDTPQIPYWMDYAFELTCRSFAHTVEDDDPASAPQQMLDKIIPDLIRKDAMTQRRLGVMRGGVLPRTIPIDPMYPASIGDPSSAIG